MSLKKQKLIINAALQNGGSITKKEAILVPGVDTYYCNERKHVGDILSRMVNNGSLIRIKPGHFKVGNFKK